MRIPGRASVRVSSVMVIVLLLLVSPAQARGFSRIARTRSPNAPTVPKSNTTANTIAPNAVQANIGFPYLSEVSPFSSGGNPAWVEIGMQLNQLFLPLVSKTAATSAQAEAVAGASSATALPSYSLSGWQVSDEDGNNYTIPPALAPMPANAILVILFDGLGPAGDDYDFSDGVATLHSPSGMTGIFEPAGDQAALYRGATHTSSTLADFLAWGQPAGSDEANALGAGLWSADAFLSFDPGFGAGGVPSPNQPDQTFGVWQNGKAASPTDWASYTSGQSSKGELNPPPTPMGSTVADGAVIAGETFGVAWAGVYGALGYQFELAATPAFTSLLVSLTTGYPGWSSPTPMPDGAYYWRVRTVTSKGNSAYLGPLQIISKLIDAPVLNSSPQPAAVSAVTVTLLSNAQYRIQRKDTTMLDIGGGPGNMDANNNPVGSTRFGDANRWDGPHLDGNGAALFSWNGYDNWYCVRASTAMLDTFYGGNLSEDRISYHIWEEWATANGGNSTTGKPEGDMGFRQGFGSYSSHLESLQWALGATVIGTSYCPTNVSGVYTCTTGGAAPITWPTVKALLDSGKPFMSINKNNAHARVVDGYRILADNSQWVRILDPVPDNCNPECGTSGIRWEAFDTFKEDNERTYAVNGSTSARSDEASIGQDTDGDGVNDFDEIVRFHTDPLNPDSDLDWVNDKSDIAEYVFNNVGSYKPRSPDINSNTVRKELDWDNDSDGAPDGCEDVNGDGVLANSGETNNFSAASKQSCKPRFSILAPTSNNVANAGDPTNPGKVLVQLSMALPGALPNPPALNKNQFTARIGDKNASLLSGAKVGQEFWLLVSPPTQTASSTYSISVSFTGSQTDTEASAVYYGPRQPMDTVIVFDVSGSMGDSNKIGSAQNAARLYVDQWEAGDRLGLVTFSDTAKVHSSLAPIPANLQLLTTTRNLINALSPAGQTAMGSGLQLGQQQLTSSGNVTHAWSLMLMTDGQENVEPYWSNPSVQNTIINTQTVVNTIGLGPTQATWFGTLQAIANATGGVFNAVDSPGQSLAQNALDQPVTPQAIEAVAAFPGTVANKLANSYKHSAERGLREQRFLQESGVLTGTQRADYSINLNSFGEVLFTLNLQQVSNIQLQITGPGGAITPSTPGVIYRKDTTHEQYRIKSPAAGTWRVSAVGIPSALGFPPTEFLLVGSGITPLAMNLIAGEEVSGTVPVLVTLADSAIIPGANVSVTLIHPNGFVASPLKLFDDGTHGDGLANDGIYGNWFNPLTSGLYQIEAKAIGVDSGGKPFTRYAQTTWRKVRPVAYLYTNSSNLSAYQQFKDLLKQVGLPLVGVSMSNITRTNWSAYQMIIAGQDTGYLTTWGVPVMVTALQDSRLPIIGIGEGGYALFGRMGLLIGDPHGNHEAITRTVPVSPTSTVWNTPFVLTGAAPYSVYTHTSSVDLYFAGVAAPPGVELVGQLPAPNAAYYNLTVQSSRYALWSFDGPPSLMTPNGQKLFLNFVKKMD